MKWWRLFTKPIVFESGSVLIRIEIRPEVKGDVSAVQIKDTANVGGDSDES